MVRNGTCYIPSSFEGIILRSSVFLCNFASPRNKPKPRQRPTTLGKPRQRPTTLWFHLHGLFESFATWEVAYCHGACTNASLVFLSELLAQRNALVWYKNVPVEESHSARRVVECLERNYSSKKNGRQRASQFLVGWGCLSNLVGNVNVWDEWPLNEVVWRKYCPKPSVFPRFSAMNITIKRRFA